MSLMQGTSDSRPGKEVQGKTRRGNQILWTSREMGILAWGGGTTLSLLPPRQSLPITSHAPSLQAPVMCTALALYPTLTLSSGESQRLLKLSPFQNQLSSLSRENLPHLLRTS